MAIPSGGMVYSGRDNSGAAAIVDSTQDTSFIENTMRAMAQERIAERERQDKINKDLQKSFEDMSLDPIGQEELDIENEGLIRGVEDKAVGYLDSGKSPFDYSTEEGRDVLRERRKAEANYAKGKAAQAQYALVMGQIGKDGIDQAEIMEWKNGYDNAKPKEGQTIAEAKAEYVNSNPYRPTQAITTHSFVAPLLENISRGQKGRVEELDKSEVIPLLYNHATTPEGMETMRKDMKRLGLNPETDVDAYINSQYELIEAKYPTKVRPATKSSSGGGGKDRQSGYTLTHSPHENMLQGVKYNAIQLSGPNGTTDMSLESINVGDNKVATGTPKAIVRDKNGDLFLEFTVDIAASGDSEKRTEKRYTPYDNFRSRIIDRFGRDISEDLLGSEPSSNSAAGSGMSKSELDAFIEDAKNRARNKAGSEKN